MRVTPRTATLRSPPVQLSPWQTRFMHSPRGLTHIGMSLKSTVLSWVRTLMPSRPRWPSFAPTRTISRSSWLNSSLFTLHHCHHHHSDSLGRISMPYFLFVIEDTDNIKFGSVCMCGCTGWLNFIFKNFFFIFACFRRVLGLIFISFSLFCFF